MSRHRSHCLRTVWPIITLFSVVGACAQPGARASSPPREPPASYVRPTRSGPECDSVRQKASTSRAEDTVGMQRAVKKTLAMLPLPIPPVYQNRAMRFLYRVDDRGAVMADSIEILGSVDHPYTRDLRRSIALYTYWPAVRDGCAVSARSETRVRTGTSFSR